MPTAAGRRRTGRVRSAVDTRRVGQPVGDAVLAISLAVAAFLPILSSIGIDLSDVPQRRPDLVGVVLVLGQCLPLAVRTTRPAACLLVVAPAFAVHEALGYPLSIASFGLLAALYSAGAHQERFRRRLLAVATIEYLALAGALHLLGAPRSVLDFVVFYLVLALAWAAGAWVRARRAEDAERRRRAVVDAQQAERARIARELHDVVTHHVTAMVVQADAAQYVLHETPDRAEAGMEAISGTGRRALTELRHLLDVLEATSATDPVVRAPVLGRLEDLAEQARSAGQPVELIEHGSAGPVPVDVELAVYRVVQESLTNALVHAAGRATVVQVTRTGTEIEVDVRTAGPEAPTPRQDRPGRSSGRGLAGLRERVALVGGELASEPLPDGGFQVRARVPIAGGR